MGYLNIFGEETGDAAECIATSGTFSIQATTKRTGGYAAQFNLSAAAGYIEYGGLGSGGLPAELGRTAATYYVRYIQFGTLPSSNSAIVAIVSSAGADVVHVEVNSSGEVSLHGATSSATIATLTTGVMYRLEIKVVSNGTSEAKIDGGTVQTCTANNVTQDRVRFGTSSAATYNLYCDDGAISDSAYPGAGEVRRMDMDADSAWGFGGSYADADEVPPDGDTTNAEFEGTVGGAAIATLESSASAGIGGTIGAVKSVAVVRRVTGGAGHGSLNVGIKVGAGNYTTSESSQIDTSYHLRGKIWADNPDDAAAWETTDLDSLLAQPARRAGFGATDSKLRLTHGSVMVWSTGQVTHEAAATLATIVTASAAGIVSKYGVATLPATAAVSAASYLTMPGTATLPTVVSLSALGGLSLAGAATLPTVVSLSADGDVGKYATATLAMTAALTAAGLMEYGGGATLSATASLSAALVGEFGAEATLAALATLSAAGLMTFSADVTLAVLAAVSADGSITSEANATLAVIVTLAALGILDRERIGHRRPGVGSFYKPLPGVGSFYRPRPGVGSFHRPPPGVGHA